MFETASFHLVKTCNMKCKFCYATFDDMNVKYQLTLQQAETIVMKLAEAGLQKITFAGGEPFLYRHLEGIIKFSKRIGLTTSIITNGALMFDPFLKDMKGYLDWIGLSIDSVYAATNANIGRKSKLRMDYNVLVEQIREHGYKLKINTVVNRYNKDENMNEFIRWAKPERWKILQALPVKGQNDAFIDALAVTTEEFYKYVDVHKQHAPIVEDNERMTGSYLLIDPLGRLFENSTGAHTYSDSLFDNDLDHCLSQIKLNREMFLERGGVYAW